MFCSDATRNLEVLMLTGSNKPPTCARDDSKERRIFNRPDRTCELLVYNEYLPGVEHNK